MCGSKAGLHDQSFCDQRFKVCFDQSVWQCKPLVRLVYMIKVSVIKVSVIKVCFDQSVWQCKPLVRLVYMIKVSVIKVCCDQSL